MDGSDWFRDWEEPLIGSKAQQTEYTKCNVAIYVHVNVYLSSSLTHEELFNFVTLLLLFQTAILVCFQENIGTNALVIWVDYEVSKQPTAHDCGSQLFCVCFMSFYSLISSLTVPLRVLKWVSSNRLGFTKVLRKARICRWTISDIKKHTLSERCWPSLKRWPEPSQSSSVSTLWWRNAA